MHRAVFLDRDGTLVRAFPEGNTTRGPRTRSEIEPLPGVEAGCRQLAQAGYLLICVTNQPDVARSIMLACSVNAVNDAISGLLDLDDVLMCPHDGSACCCRKPKPGLIYAAAYRFEIDLAQSWMVGDRDSDHLAAVRAGVRYLDVASHSFTEAVQCILTI